MRGWEPREESWLLLPRALPGREGWGEHGAGTVRVPRGSYLWSPAMRVPCNVPPSCLAAPPRRPRRGLCVNRPQVSH